MTAAGTAMKLKRQNGLSLHHTQLYDYRQRRYGCYDLLYDHSICNVLSSNSQNTVLPLPEILVVGLRTRTACLCLCCHVDTVLHSTCQNQAETGTVIGTRRHLPAFRFPASRIQETVTRLSKLGALRQTCPAFSSYAATACGSMPCTASALEKLLPS